MLQKLKIKVATLAAIFLSAMPALLVPAVATAQTTANPQNAICEGANNLSIPEGGNVSGDCATIGNNSVSNVNNLLHQIINIFSVVVGIIAVIMIIVGGFRYITSGGQAEKVTSAKNTILYALIGLVIVALAQVVVKFVLSKATGNS